MSTFEEKLANQRENREPTQQAPNNSRTQHGMEEYAKTAASEHEQMKAHEKLRGDFVHENQRHPREGELEKRDAQRQADTKDQQPQQAQGERGGYPSALEAKQAMLERQAAHKREQQSQQQDRNTPDISIAR
jgi:hypothetical protein